MMSPINSRWIKHWWTLPHVHLIPLRASFDPADVPSLLPFLEMHDLREPGVSRLRLVGTKVAQRHGKDPTGEDYLRFVTPERRDEAYRGLMIPYQHPCGMRVVMSNTFESGLSALIEAVGLPFQFNDTGGPMVMFTDVIVGDAMHLHTNLGRLVRYVLHERQFIDVGAGIPEGHIDTLVEPRPQVRPVAEP
ncbi:hypothetical protein BAL199_19136 [alpha proteobacterium BAL199]|jgi:hypothetical protein|nr:hypothetical protein BAL199_19136 [alpha proteobacterium BAL199]